VRTVGLAVAACVIAALATGCDAGVMNSASATGVSPAAAPSLAAEVPAAITGRPAKFGERRPVGESLQVTVLAPRSFVPGETAYPRAERGVAFEIMIENQGSHPYRPTQLQVRVADPAGERMAPIVDKAQGYAGGLGSGNEVQPGRNTRFTLAFQAPRQQVDLHVTVQPDMNSAQQAEFAGGG
jgi:hypothetical protein